MSDRPVVVFALAPWALHAAFPAAVRARLARVADVLPGGPLTSFAGRPAAAALAAADILVTGWECPRVDGAVLDAAPRLRAVLHAAGTVKKHIDPAVYARGVTVSSAAQANARPVADFTLAALVLGAKRAFTRARRYSSGAVDGVWQPGAGTGLHGCVVGVIGASRIGRLVLDRLRRLDVTVLLADPHVTPAEAARLGAELTEVDTLCRRSHLVTVHAPALPETRHLIDARRLALMPDGGVLINTARGSIVDTDALTAECASGRLSAVLDVTDPEPLPPGHPLLTLENAFVTPHLAGAQGREVSSLGEFVVADIERLVRGEPLLGRIHAHQLAFMA